MRKLLTAEQAQNLLQVSRQTLANWEKSGKVDTVRIGGVVRYWIDTTPNGNGTGKNASKKNT